MTAPLDLHLAQLVCSRLCHDLAGLTGAIANGADLIAESSGAPDGEALALIGDSARQANARIAFFRAAFGASTTAQSLAEAMTLVDGVLAGGSVRASPPVGDAARVKISPDGVRQFLVLVLAAAGCLPRGGTIAIEAAALAEGAAVGLSASGTGAILKSDLAAALGADVSPAMLSPREVHGYWAGLLARASGGRVEAVQGEGVVRLAVLLPKG